MTPNTCWKHHRTHHHRRFSHFENAAIMNYSPHYTANGSVSLINSCEILKTSELLFQLSFDLVATHCQSSNLSTLQNSQRLFGVTDAVDLLFEFKTIAYVKYCLTFQSYELKIIYIFTIVYKHIFYK